MWGLQWYIIKAFVSLGEAEFELESVTVELVCELIIWLFNAHYIGLFSSFSCIKLAGGFQGLQY